MQFSDWFNDKYQDLVEHGMQQMYLRVNMYFNPDVYFKLQSNSDSTFWISIIRELREINISAGADTGRFWDCLGGSCRGWIEIADSNQIKQLEEKFPIYLIERNLSI
jgi:hypothetical protein